MILIDNYDSFTYSLVQLLRRAKSAWRNDQITLDEARALRPSHIVISPGPSTPDDSGISPT